MFFYCLCNILAAFGLPIIQQIDPKIKHVQAIVLCPTRELCIQIAKDLIAFSKYLDYVKVLPVYGGTNIEKQIKSIKKGVQIIVGTPGRTKDLIKRKILKLDIVNKVVLEAADTLTVDSDSNNSIDATLTIMEIT